MFNVGTANQFQVSSTGVMSAAAGSTVGTEAICLADGTHCPSTTAAVSGMTAGYIPLAATAATITGNSHLDDGVTLSGVLTSSEQFLIDYSSPTRTSIEIYNAIGHAWFLNSTGSSGYASAPANSLSFQDATGMATPLYLTSTAVVALKPVSMPTGSTVNSTNICLADGTGCPSNTTNTTNTYSTAIYLTTATSDSTTITVPPVGEYNSANCVFSPANSTATALTILPWIYVTSYTGTTLTVTMNHAATVGNGAAYNVVCSLFYVD
jgi:hypothetical protein